MIKSIKKTLLFITSIFFIFAFMSCGSTKEIANNESEEILIVPSGEEDDEELSSFDVDDEVLVLDIQEVDTSSTDNDANTEDVEADYYEEENLKTEKTEKKNFFTTLLSLDKFVEIDYTDFYTSSISGGLKKEEASIVVRSKDKWVGFSSPYMTAYYYITMDEDARLTLRNAVNHYLQDFENKKLIRKTSKTISAYGSAEIRADWGVLRKSVPYTGTGPAMFGYKFKDKSPYFTITINPVITDKRKEGDNTAVECSMRLTYFFTKAQAKALVQLLDEKVINSYLYDDYENENNDDDSTEIIGDEY